MGRFSTFGFPGLLLGLALTLWGCDAGRTSAAQAGAEDRAPGVLRARLPDGRKLAFRCTGHGSPTVILESGYAGSSLGWNKVQPAVAAVTRVCSYDRAGYGLSDPGPGLRDGAATARDLDWGLKAAKIKGPYVLVAHSAGGLYARLFAARRPKDVLGMVLVDPSVEHQNERFAALFGPGTGELDGQKARARRCMHPPAAATAATPEFASCFRDGKLVPATVWRTQLSEAETLWNSTSDQVDRIGDILQEIPVVVLTAQNSYAGDSPAARLGQRLWRRLHRELAARFLDGVVRDVPSGHLMMVERPEVVNAAALEMVAKARASSAGGGPVGSQSQP